MTQSDKISRPSLETTYMEIAKAISARSTCRHRDQGAVLVKNNHLVSVGYNGSAPGQIHCIDARDCSKEQGYSCKAEGLHGESNALAFAAKLGISVEGSILYSVYSPCFSCCNLLKVAGIVGVVYGEVYSGYTKGPEYLEELGIWCRQTVI